MGNYLGPGGRFGATSKGMDSPEIHTDGHRRIRAVALAPEQTGAVFGCRQECSSVRNPDIPAGGQFSGGGECRGIGGRGRPRPGRGEPGELPETQCAGHGDSRQQAGDDGHRAALRRAFLELVVPHCSTRMTARAESTGSGMSRPTTGMAVRLR